TINASTATAEGRLSCPRSTRRLEQLDRVAVGIFDLDLSPARPGQHLVPKAEAGFFQSFHALGKIVDPEHDPVPTAGRLFPAVRHRPGAGRLWPAQQDVHVAERYARERRQLLV